MKDIQVIILAAGNASRLWPISLSTPKSLLSLNGKPGVFNMLNPLVKSGIHDITFVVSNENKKIMQSVIDRVYINADVDIRYVVQDKQRGPGDALGFCETYIDKPTILLLGDTICSLDFDFENSWLGVYEITDNSYSQWCMAATDKDKSITQLIDKPKFKCDTNYAAIGIYFFNNPKVLCSAIKEAKKDILPVGEEFQISSIVKRYMEKEDVKIKCFEDWCDIGTLNNYSKAIKAFSNCNHTNKTFGNGHDASYKLSSEVGVKSDVEYIDYPVLSEFFVYYKIREESWKYIFSELLKRVSDFWERDTNANIESYCESIYIERTLSRIKNWSRKDLLDLDYYYINGQRIPGFWKLWDELIPYIRRIIKSSSKYAAYIHGDLSFENILYSPRSSVFKIVDSKENFGEKGIIGDYRYDIAKLRHCYHGHYDIIKADLVQIEEKRTGMINFNLYIKDVPASNIFDEQIKQMGVECDDIEIIESLLFISMIPLHADSPQRQLAFFITGIQCMYNQILKRGELCG